MNPGFDWAALAEFSIVGLLSGGLLAMIALGFVLIYKGTGVINFAMGEFMMLGAYFFYTANVMWGLPLAVALVLSFAAVAVAAAVIERGVLRPLAGQPVISVLMATIGLASAIHGAVDAVWGGRNYELPSLLPRAPIILGDVLIPGKTLWSFLMAMAVIAGFVLYFRFSRTGVSMRAAASDPTTAYVLGIDVRATQRLTWIFAGVVGALAGIIVASTTSLSPAVGSAALGVLAIIILGGLDSIPGAIVAGLIVGMIESLTAGYLGGKVRDIVPYATVLVILLVRPYGLFGTRQIERL
ncbi:branched-chain amino acid ABC transporter permease [Ramlibacter sp. RBP-2]|uniref:Branched-chain amino acid ABC transporter permease n=1 Tax=Ramlibacter lithotrophicus TaxID=2606681 RepID=A0A7X6DFN0_9BURK|nr:branched-chain amino acid ABC transporter permease [Ramlibacter lithotrophicus]NKE66301.1 branched-chain amino acid ABC transporter permease [Ramlibacter lithotrophicus]